MSRFRPGRGEVLALYAEHEEEVIAQPTNNEMVHSIPMKGGEKLVIVKQSFVLKRGFSEDVRGKRVLVVEDVLTTGGSAARTLEAVHRSGGILVGLGVLANGGNIKAEDCGVDRLEALTNVERQLFTEKECLKNGLCAKNVPINTDFGHGREFLERQRRK